MELNFLLKICLTCLKRAQPCSFTLVNNSQWVNSGLELHSTSTSATLTGQRIFIELKNIGIEIIYSRMSFTEKKKKIQEEHLEIILPISYWWECKNALNLLRWVQTSVVLRIVSRNLRCGFSRLRACSPNRKNVWKPTEN